MMDGSAEILAGKPVVEAMNFRMQRDVEILKAKGITPMLAIVRVGEKPDDISYERGVARRSEQTGVEIHNIRLSEDVSQNDLLRTIGELNKEDSVHGILILRPLPKQIDDGAVRWALSPEKDVDGITDTSLASLFTGRREGFAPCTAQACIEILDYYGVDPLGKHAVVVGRSLVVGKPASMMLSARHATVTICHTRTVDLPVVCREADILIVSAGCARLVGAGHLSAGQTVIDVGINVGEDGKICGDVDFEAATGIVGGVTPVPNGVGTVTTSVLLMNTVEAARRLSCA